MRCQSVVLIGYRVRRVRFGVAYNLRAGITRVISVFQYTSTPAADAIYSRLLDGETGMLYTGGAFGGGENGFIRYYMLSRAAARGKYIIITVDRCWETLFFFFIVKLKPKGFLNYSNIRLSIRILQYYDNVVMFTPVIRAKQNARAACLKRSPSPRCIHSTRIIGHES